MTMSTLALGAALVAFSPIIALFSMIVYHKAQLVIVVTTAAFFFLLSSVIASAFWWTFHAIGFHGPLAAIIPGVFFQFLFRCSFVSLYHNVEKVIEASLQKQQEDEERKKRQERNNNNNNNDSSNATAEVDTRGTVRQPHRHRHHTTDAAAAQAAVDPTSNSAEGREEQEQEQGEEESFTQAARFRLQLNDASCGVAAGVGYGAMHAILFYGTLLASEISNNVGVLYQDSCPAIPSLVVSAIYCCAFSVLDIFWMLFTFFGMRRRLLFHRGELSSAHDNRRTGGLLGNNRTGGNLALLLTLGTHFLASVFTTADFFKGGCVVSLPCVGGLVLVVAYAFWAGVGRIYLPNEQKARVAALQSGGGISASRSHHSYDDRHVDRSFYNNNIQHNHEQIVSQT